MEYPSSTAVRELDSLYLGSTLVGKGSTGLSSMASLQLDGSLASVASISGSMATFTAPSSGPSGMPEPSQGPRTARSTITTTSTSSSTTRPVDASIVSGGFDLDSALIEEIQSIGSVDESFTGPVSSGLTSLRSSTQLKRGSIDLVSASLGGFPSSGPSSSLSSSELELSGSLTGMTSRGSQPSSSMVVIPSSAAGASLGPFLSEPSEMAPSLEAGSPSSGPSIAMSSNQLEQSNTAAASSGVIEGKLPDDSSSSAAMSSAMLVSDASKDSSSYIASEASSAPGPFLDPAFLPASSSISEAGSPSSGPKSLVGSLQFAQSSASGRTEQLDEVSTEDAESSWSIRSYAPSSGPFGLPSLGPNTVRPTVTITTSGAAASTSLAQTTTSTTATSTTHGEADVFCTAPSLCLASSLLLGCNEIAAGTTCEPEVLGGTCVEVSEQIGFRCPTSEASVAVLEGTVPQVLCGVCAVMAEFVDIEVEAGVIAGELRFGPNARQGVIYEENVEEYRVYFVDDNDETVGEPLDVIAATAAATLEDACCPDALYVAELRSELPATTSGLRLAVMVVAYGAQLPSTRFSDPILDLGSIEVQAVQGEFSVQVADREQFLEEGQLIVVTVLADVFSVPSELVQLDIAGLSRRRLQDTGIFTLTFWVIVPRTITAATLLTTVQTVNEVDLEMMLLSRMEGVAIEAFSVDGLVGLEALGRTSSTTSTSGTSSTSTVSDFSEASDSTSSSTTSSTVEKLAAQGAAEDGTVLPTLVPAAAVTVVTVAIIVGIVVVRRYPDGCVVSKRDVGDSLIPIPDEAPPLPQAELQVETDLLRDAGRAAGGLAGCPDVHMELVAAVVEGPSRGDVPPPPEVEGEPPGLWRLQGPPLPPNVDTPPPPREVLLAEPSVMSSVSSEGHVVVVEPPERLRVQGSAFRPPCFARHGYKFCCCGCGPDGRAADDSTVPEWDCSDTRSNARSYVRAGRSMEGEMGSEVGTPVSASGGVGVSDPGRTVGPTSAMASPLHSGRGSTCSPNACSGVDRRDWPEMLWDEHDAEFLEPAAESGTPGQSSLRMASRSSDIAVPPPPDVLPPQPAQDHPPRMDDDDELLTAAAAAAAVATPTRADAAQAQPEEPWSSHALALSPIAADMSASEMSNDVSTQRQSPGGGSDTPSLSLCVPGSSGRVTQWVFSPPPRPQPIAHGSAPTEEPNT